MSIWVILIVLAIVGVMLYIRFVPIDTKYYVQSPKTAPSDGKPHEYRLINDNAPEFEMSASELADRVDSILTNDLGGKQIDGGQVPNAKTYEVRTKLMGYRDYVSVEIDKVSDNRSRLNIFSRSHFGTGDMGANKARVEKILELIPQKTSNS